MAFPKPVPTPTVAVKLTLWFRTDGLPEVLIATDVAAWFTVSVTEEEKKRCCPRTFHRRCKPP